MCVKRMRKEQQKPALGCHENALPKCEWALRYKVLPYITSPAFHLHQPMLLEAKNPIHQEQRPEALIN